MSDNVVVPTHPLLTKEVRPIEDWLEFLKLWEQAQHVQTLESLLHVGFGVALGRKEAYGPPFMEKDRWDFYFKIADGWANYFFWPFEGREQSFFVGHDSYGNRQARNLNELRQQVASKAFVMLCQNLFKVELRSAQSRGRFSLLWDHLTSEEFFPVLQDFFRVEEDRHGCVSIPNLGGWAREDSLRDVVRDFLYRLAVYVWKRPQENLYWGEGKEKREVELASRLNASKPWLIEVLFQIDRTTLLEEEILQLDNLCLEKLNQIALRTETRGNGKNRRVTSVDEACYYGSLAGWLLKGHELKVREQARIEALRDAERKREEAERKIQELSGK